MAAERLPHRLGLFGLGEILLTMEEGLAFKGKTGKIDPRIVLKTWATLPRYWMTSLRSCVIGCWMGITPGGATPASFMSYGIAKRSSRDGAKFGVYDDDLEVFTPGRHHLAYSRDILQRIWQEESRRPA